MAGQLNPKIMPFLTSRLNKKKENISPRISELRRKHSGLTMNAAAQMYAESHGTSIMAKLSQEDRQSLSMVHAITQVSVSNSQKVDRRTLNINNSAIHNLSYGDRNTVTQNVIALDDELNKLSSQIDNHSSLTEEEKSDYKSDIETIATQVGKSKPNREIIKAAWESIKALSTVAGFASSIATITPLIQNFL